MLTRRDCPELEAGAVFTFQAPGLRLLSLRQTRDRDSVQDPSAVKEQYGG